MSVADRLNKLSTDITNAYTSINNKGGTIPTNKNTDNLHTAIDSIEVIETATAEGESLSLTNTKAMPYKDYVVEGKSTQEGTPSPSNPSEIHSVADDVNLFDVGTISDYRNFYNDGDVANWFSINSNILNVIIQESGATMFYNKKQYKGNENYTIKLKSSMVGNRIYIKLRNANNTDWLTNSDVTISNMTYNSYYKGWFYQSAILNTTLTISVPNCLYCCIGFGFGSDNIGTTQTIENIKIQKGSVATPYSPYNQGTVTIKQRGKNLWTSNLPILYSDVSSIVQDNNNGGIDMTIANSTSLGYIFYDLGLISDFAGKTLTFSISNEPNALYKWCALMACNADGSNRQELKNFYENNQITYTVGNNYSQTHLAVRLYIAEATGGQTYSINNVQVEENSEKTPYEPYQGNDYTFQTAPLRSLPNGVKDTMELQDMQNHTRIGRQTGTLTETTTITLSDAKTDGAYMCNIKPSGTLTGKTIELEAGDYEIIYELAEEVIEPLTQNQATTMLDIIKTGSYEGTTNIYTDEDVKPTMKVDYYKKK